MDRELAKRLLEFVNHKQNTDDLKLYADKMISQYKTWLVTAKDIEEVRKYQGAIQALEKIYTLREEVHQAMK